MGTILKDSTISISEASPLSRAVQVKILSFNLKFKSSVEAEQVAIAYSATAKIDDETLSISEVKTTEIEAKVGEKEVERIELPVVLLVESYKDDIEELALAFAKGEIKNNSYSSKAGIKFEISSESFVDSSGLSWMVFVSPDIDGKNHKLNFTYSAGVVSEFELDGWCQWETETMKVSDTPAVKSDDSSLSDEEALELGLKTYQFLIVAQSFASQEGAEIPFLKVDRTDDNTMTVSFEEGYKDSLVFGKEVPVTGTLKVKDNAGTIDLKVGNDEIDMIAQGDGSGSSTGGFYSVFKINGQNYAHLRESLYFSSIKLMSFIDIFMANNLLGTVAYVVSTSDFQNTANLSYDREKGEIVFTDFKRAPQSTLTISGTLKVNSDGTRFAGTDFIVKEEKGVTRTVSAVIVTDDSGVRCESFSIKEFGGACTQFELEMINSSMKLMNQGQ